MHQEQPEVFSVSVGNLPANCEVIIKITYVAELPIENNDIIFRLPAKVASWQSKQALEMKDQTILPSINLGQDNSSMKSVEFSLKTSIRMPYEIMKLFSPTHRLRRKITDCIAMIELIDNILLEKDFILSITLKTVNLPRMLNETYDLSNENSQACMLTFYPKFEMTNNTNEYMEIVFLIDVSNSMDGKHIQQAKQLAHLFLTNMKQNDGTIYFNIVTFGSDNDECFPISSPNTKENIDKAKHFILHSLDHRGNTDLFSVLRQYALIPSSSKLGRQFILLSDGHINDLKSILSLLENQSSMRHDRLFTCSIGDISNKHTLKQLANQANGGGLNTVFDSDYRSRWKTKVLQILEHIHQPCVTNISIDWHGNVDNQREKFTNQAPKLIRSLFNGMRLTVYRFIANCHKATLTATINDQEFVTSVFSSKVTETQGRILHCLTARSIIQDYENGLLDNDESENELIKKQFKQDLIELSIKYSVVSSFTSFVAIEERDGDDFQPGVRLLDVMRENDIDLLPYIAWDGERSQIDLIKEKLINAKRLFDNASISNKIQLTNEYEDLCKNISYRSGGDAKYELMLNIIDTYRTTLKEKDKARQLEEKMKDGK
jgi:poly [ADP-ribose] polymerase